MSHFRVLVIGTEDIEGALAPFNEQPDDGSPLLKFVDCTDEVRADFEKRDDPAKYPTLAAFARDYYGYKSKGDRFGHYSNPNAKWDWWEIGGRWPGSLCTARGKANQARKREIDFGPERDEGERRMREHFGIWSEALKGNPKPETWETVLARFELKAGGHAFDSARAAYHAQPAIAAWKSAAEKHDRWLTFDVDPVRDYGFDLDAAVALARRKAGVPFAFLLNGEWHEKGRMGWWACVSDEKANWLDVWEAAWTGLADDALVTSVDCHI